MMSILSRRSTMKSRPTQTRRPGRRLWCDRLEDRLAPATIFFGSTNDDTFTITESDGSYFLSVDLNSDGSPEIVNQLLAAGDTVDARGNSTNGDTLIGPDMTNTWFLESLSLGNVNGVGFSGFENLTGGNGDDTFQVRALGSVSGTIDGGEGVNTLDYLAYPSNVVVDLTTAFATGIGDGASNRVFNIDNVVGGSGFNTLTGDANDNHFAIVAGSGTINGMDGFDTVAAGGGDNLWLLTDQDAGTLNNTITFTYIENLIGGDGDDTFQPDNNVTFAGYIEGGGGYDIVDYQLRATGVAIDRRLSDLPGVTIHNSIEGVNAQIGQIRGPDEGTEWTLTGSDSGYVNGFAFTGFHYLYGGDGDDIFHLPYEVDFAGCAYGGDGFNWVSFAASPEPKEVDVDNPRPYPLNFNDIGGIMGTQSSDDVVFKLQAGPTTWSMIDPTTVDVNGFKYRAFEILSGHEGQPNELVYDGAFAGVSGPGVYPYPPSEDYWDIDNDRVTLYGATFVNVQSLVGGVGNDTFRFLQNGPFSVSINGGIGQNTVDYSVLTDYITVNVRTSVLPNIDSHTQINRVIGSSDPDEPDVLDGAGGTNTWTMSADDSLTVNDWTYAGFEKLVSGSADDTIIGGNNGNTWNILNSDQGELVRTVVTRQVILGPGSSRTVYVNGIPITTGASFSITFNDVPTAYTTSFVGIRNLTGGSHGDQFVLHPNGSISGVIDSGDGGDTLDYSAFTGAPVTVNLDNASGTGVSNFTGIESLVGSASTADTLTGRNSGSSWGLFRPDGGYVDSFVFQDFENLLGGSGTDSFFIIEYRFAFDHVDFGPGYQPFTGTLDGGDGAPNSLTFWANSDFADPGPAEVRINLHNQHITNKPGITTVLSFSQIANIADIHGAIISLNGAETGTTTWTFDDSPGVQVNAIRYHGVQSRAAGAGDDHFIVTAAPPTGLTLNGGDGSDTYDITFGNLAGTIGVTDTGISGSDSLTLNGTDFDDSLDKIAGFVRWKLDPDIEYRERVDFSGIESGTLNAAAGNDHLLDPDTANWTLLGGLGDDTIIITGAVGNVSVDAGPGSNTVMITMGALTGPVAVNGSEGSTDLFIQAPSGENELVLTSTELVSGSEIIQFNLGSTAASITIDGSAGDNSLVVQGPPPAPLTPVNIDVESTPSTLQGLVWLDFNNDGEVNFGEQAIAGVTMTLTGFDDLGNAVYRSVQTDAQGIYSFTNLRPSYAAGYTITQSQPAGYLDGRDTLGTINDVLVGSDAVNDVFSGIFLPQGSLAENYNFGERPPNGGNVGAGQTATIGFWQNKNGQNLIKALNGGATATQLGTWLAATFPNMYASLDGLTNSQVAAHYKTLFGRNAQSSLGGPPKVDAQIMATALAVYVTNQTLAGNTAAAYGFQVTPTGVGTRTFNVGNTGAAFGVANNTFVSVMDLLLAVNARSANGLLFDTNGDGVISANEAGLRTMANNVFSLINESGGI